MGVQSMDTDQLNMMNLEEEWLKEEEELLSSLTEEQKKLISTLPT